MNFTELLKSKRFKIMVTAIILSVIAHYLDFSVEEILVIINTPAVGWMYSQAQADKGKEAELIKQNRK